MDKKDDKKDFKEILLGIVVALVPLGFGAWMVAMPRMMEGAHPHGRRVLLKMLVAWLWGYPAGVILIILGLLLLWAVFLPDGPDDEDDEDD